jgi:hypothetical protein
MLHVQVDHTGQVAMIIDMEEQENDGHPEESPGSQLQSCLVVLLPPLIRKEITCYFTKVLAAISQHPTT